MLRLGTHARFQFYQIVVICSLSLDIVHVGYLVFMSAGTCSSKHRSPFRYMFDPGM
jgi:hypothetical protein